MFNMNHDYVIWYVRTLQNVIGQCRLFLVCRHRSVSFVLGLSSMAYLLLAGCYLLIDVWHVWSGAPCIFPGTCMIYSVHVPQCIGCISVCICCISVCICLVFVRICICIKSYVYLYMYLYMYRGTYTHVHVCSAWLRCRNEFHSDLHVPRGVSSVFPGAVVGGADPRGAARHEPLRCCNLDHSRSCALL